VPLPEDFASIFSEPAAQRGLAEFRPHVRLPTFNLTATSLRHLNMWLDRLDEINRGGSRPHGNFFADPAAIGLVDNAARPRVLTQAGHAFLAFRPYLRNNPLRSEYELLNILYFGGHNISPQAHIFLSTKQQHLEFVLSQFTPAPNRHLFLTHPKLLVIAELIATFDGAISNLLSLAESDLLRLESLGESGFRNLCTGNTFPPGLNALCRRIGSDYTRGEERRLHHLVSMCLLTAAQRVPQGHAQRLVIPTPYCNLLTETDIYDLHVQYTSDVSIWFDGVGFQITNSLAIAPGTTVPPTLPLRLMTLQPQTRVPSGTGSAPATAQRRQSRRSAKPTAVTIILDPVLSERAEDLAEQGVLRPRYGSDLVRVGHRNGETIALPDGMVPGADFYVVDALNAPIEYIEIKSVSGNPPFDVIFTRAEYMRAERCTIEALPYRLILVDVATGQLYEVANFAPALVALRISEAVQIVVRVIAGSPNSALQP
jgi:hypothetical protein